MYPFHLETVHNENITILHNDFIPHTNPALDESFLVPSPRWIRWWKAGYLWDLCSLIVHVTHSHQGASNNEFSLFSFLCQWPIRFDYLHDITRKKSICTPYGIKSVAWRMHGYCCTCLGQACITESRGMRRRWTQLTISLCKKCIRYYLT